MYALALLSLLMTPVLAKDLIVYTSNMMDTPQGAEANTEIFLMDVDTRKVDRLTRNNYMDHMPALHPNGKLVAFITDRFRYDLYGEDQILLKNLSSGKEERVDIGLHMVARNPRFSPDGNFLYFSLAPYATQETANASYRLMRLDLATKKIIELPGEEGNFFDVSPSPDGKYLAYRYAADGDQHVRLMDLTTFESRALSLARPDSEMEQLPTWRSANEVTLVANYGEHERLQRTLFSVSVGDGMGTQIMQSPLIYDHYGACWFEANKGVVTGLENESGSLQMFLVNGEEWTKISSMDYWWSGQADCRRL